MWGNGRAWCGRENGNSRAFIFGDEGVARDVIGGYREEGCRVDDNFIRRWRGKSIEEQKR